MKKTITCLLFALFLALPVTAYSDLPQSHWAYGDMSRAADLGILTGSDDGLMYPEGTLTWGQCLLMLGRAFYPPTLSAQPLREGDHWAQAAYNTALSLNVLEPLDFLPASPSSLDAPIARQDMAVLVDRVLVRVFEAIPAEVDLGAVALTDFSSLPEPYRASVLQCSTRGIIKGATDGRFAGNDTLTRGGAASLVMRALALVEDSPQEDDALPDQEGDLVLPPAEDVVRPSSLTALGENSEKLLHLFGTTQRNRFPSKAEADANTVRVTVPVWRLDSAGGKVSSTQTFSIHKSIASDMISIFTAIYNDPEQFPIKDIGGYSWRGDNAKGEHNCGTALDINYNENYQIFPNGSIGAGSFWLPGENPYSIPESGSVVRIFNAHGYTWGGNGWPSYSNKDYMHFSYLGL